MFQTGGYWDLRVQCNLEPLFNVVAEAVIQNCIMFVEAEEAGTKGFGRVVHRMATFFYSYNGLLAYMRPEWLQGEFGDLTEVFDRVGLHMNVRKTSGIVCQTYCAAGRHYEEDYARRRTGRGWYIRPTYNRGYSARNVRQN